MSTLPAVDRRVRRLAATLAGYAFLDDCILLYAVYTVLFRDTGLSVGQISSLFGIWALAGLVLEVPSGALADVVSRRLLLVVGQLFAAAGFALWVLAPGYPAFAVGFVLWGTRGALVSGALEAVVYDELAGRGAERRYAALMGRARAASTLAVLVSMVGAAAVLTVGGYRAVGAASVLACLAAAVVATRFPDPPATDPVAGTVASPLVGDRDGIGARGGAGLVALWRASLATLRTGWAETRADPTVRSAVLLVPAVAVIWGSLEEYLPLLVADTGVAVPAVPLWLALVSTGVAAGGLAAASGRRAATPSAGHLAVGLAGAAVLLALGAASGVPEGIVAVAVAFGVFQWATVAADARLQHRITGRARATVTSLAAVLTEVAGVACHAVYPLAARAGGHGVAFALCVMPYLAVAAWLASGASPLLGEPAGGVSPLPGEADHGALHHAEAVVD